MIPELPDIVLPKLPAIAVKLVYMLAVVCFILGLKWLAGPKTARRGNFISAVGMLIAILATLLVNEVVSLRDAAIGMVIGGVVGLVLALRVQMTSMPQMVALLNGFGGLASFLVAYSEVFWGDTAPVRTGSDLTLWASAVGASVLIGAVTFTGSVMAWAKLEGKVPSAPVLFPGDKLVSGLLLLAALLLAVHVGHQGGGAVELIVLGAISLVLGVLLVIPIGGADMPVVISLLNSYSGMAACATGFVIKNELLIVTGSLVGASGIILTKIMCDAMNRSLANVLFGAFGAVDASAAAGTAKKNVRKYSAEDAALVLEGARKVIVIPGYGLAVAQAQHATRDLGKLLESRGCEVKYAIHPVAGRMPGHMNVLMAEAEVPYEKLVAMEDINPEFEDCDVALVLGANDVVNPIAREKGNPMSGMPILDVDKARAVMIVKRSLAAGFAGIDNPLFYEDKTMMLFGDAKAMVTDLVKSLQALVAA